MQDKWGKRQWQRGREREREARRGGSQGVGRKDIHAQNG